MISGFWLTGSKSVVLTYDFLGFLATSNRQLIIGSVPINRKGFPRIP